MLKQIEIATELNPSLNYGPLYYEMNQLLTEYRDMISKRASINIRKAEKIDNEQEESIEVTTTTELSESAETVLQLNAEEVIADGLEPHPLEMENAVSMSSRIMQLHLVYDNGD